MRNGPPTVAELLDDPRRVAEVPPEAIPTLLCQLSALQSTLAARIINTPFDHRQGNGPDGDTLLDVREAAKRLGTSSDYLYRNSKRLPFTVRLGPRQLRFSARGIERYIRQRQGR